MLTEEKSFKNNAPSRSCTTKISNTFIGYAEDLYIFMLLEYSGDYSTTCRP